MNACENATSAPGGAASWPAVDRNARFAEQFKTATHSIPARTLIARRDNLSATITALRERLAILEAPEWNYS